jgi:hypothetical protein
MKIQTQLNKTADKISLSSSILTINGKDYDLENVKPLSENETCENQRVYLEGKDIIIFLKIDVELQFIFMSYNLMRFYDINENNLIDLSELKLIVIHWNLPEDEREAERLKIIDAYLLIEGNTKESWKLKGVPIAETA